MGIRERRQRGQRVPDAALDPIRRDGWLALWMAGVALRRFEAIPGPHPCPIMCRHLLERLGVLRWKPLPRRADPAALAPLILRAHRKAFEAGCDAT